jgi:hypothetical protein
MLLKNVKTPRTMFSIAMLCLAACIVAGRFVPASDFWTGMVTGVQGGLIGFALVLLVKSRRLKQRG